MGFGKKGKDNLEGGTPTLIGKNSSFEGNFVGNDSICIDGSFKGYIDSKENVFINKDAMVEGDIKGKNIIIHGRVKGNITAEEEIIIGQKGRVIGDISTTIFTVERGGVLHGKCFMEDKEKEVKGSSTFLDKISVFGGKRHKTISEKLDILEEEVINPSYRKNSSSPHLEEEDEVIEVVGGDEKKELK